MFNRKIFRQSHIYDVLSWISLDAICSNKQAWMVWLRADVWREVSWSEKYQLQHGIIHGSSPFLLIEPSVQMFIVFKLSYLFLNFNLKNIFLRFLCVHVDDGTRVKAKQQQQQRTSKPGSENKIGIIKTVWYQIYSSNFTHSINIFYTEDLLYVYNLIRAQENKVAGKIFRLIILKANHKKNISVYVISYEPLEVWT